MAAVAAFAAGVALVAAPFVVPAPTSATGQVHLAQVRPAQEPPDRFVDDDPGCDGNTPCYGSIQAAVDDAAQGELISVAAGRYTETVTVVDRGLRLLGPGIGESSDPDDPGAHALWVARSPAPGTALSFVAATSDITGVRISGFRFLSGTVGVSLEANGRIVLPPTPATIISDCVVSGNLFRTVGSAASGEGAVVSRWVDALAVEQNVVDSSGGFHLTGGSSLSVQANDLTNIDGDAIFIAAHGDSLTISGNVISAGSWHGIVVRPWSSVAPPSVGQNVSITANVVDGSTTEAIVIDSSAGGSLQDVMIWGGGIYGAGAGAGSGTPVMGGIGLWGGSEASLRNVSVELVSVRDTGTGGSGIHAGIHAQDVAGTLVVSGVHMLGNNGPGLRLVDTADVVVARSTITGNLGHGILMEETRAIERIEGIRIGGSTEDGNVLAPNSDDALLLVNSTGSTVSTGDVDATYNDWGTAYATTIEDKIVHRPDDILLGEVTFLPALRTPADASASADPPGIVADGQSLSEIQLQPVDVAGSTVADDALAQFASDGGTMIGAGSLVEAEADAVVGSGTWISYTSTSFGPYSGDGYLRSDEAGATLGWSFDSPAVIVRYGQTTLNIGVISATVDGNHVGTFSTVGADKMWVNRLVARDLSPGMHSISLTLTSGEVNFDRLVSGKTLESGRAAASLRSGETVGFGRVTGTVHGAGTATSTVDVAFTAGQPADLTLDVADAAISVGGVTTTVTVTALDAQGRPVADGTPVDLTTTLGLLEPASTTTVAGKAYAVLTSELLVGTATVRAESGAAFAESDVEITPGDPHTIIMNAEPRAIYANSHDTSEVAVIVRDRWDNTVADGTAVDVVTSHGTVDPPNAITSDGFAKIELTAGDSAGIATVRASAGEATGSITVTMLGTDLRITKQSAPASSVVPGESVTFTLSYANVGRGDLFGVIIDDMLPQGLISPVVRTPPRQQITRLSDRPLGFLLDRVVPGQRGDIVVAVKVDSKQPWGNRSVITNSVTIEGTGAAELTPGDNDANAEVVVVPGAVYNVALRVPDEVAVGGATGQVRVSLADRYGNPAQDGTPVTFAANIGSIEPAEATTRGGSATALFASDTRAGKATVTVTTLDERGAAATIDVKPGQAQQLELSAAQEEITVGGESTVLTATLKDMFANVVPGDEVSLETSDGLLTVSEGFTNADGLVTTTLRSPVHTGAATVTAVSELLTTDQHVRFIPAAPADLRLVLDRLTVRVGDVAKAVATAVDSFGNPVPDQTVAFESPIADAVPAQANTNADGEAAADVIGAQPGVAVVRATLGDIRDEQALEVVAGPVYLPITYR